MNTANLQLEGLYLAVAMMNRALVLKGLLSVDEVETALHIAEAIAESDRVEGLSTANRDAVCFPIRVLRLANRMAEGNAIPPFSELARAVGETKEPYNDQL